MRALPSLDGDVVELDGRGLSAVPGSRRLPHASGVCRRSRQRVRAPRHAGELRRAPRCRRRDPLDDPRDAGGEPGRARADRFRHRDAMLAHGTTTLEGKSGYGLDRETEVAQLAAIAAAGGVPTWLGAHAVPPEHRTPTLTSTGLIREVLPAAARIAVAADVFVERGTFDVEQARRYLRGMPRGRAGATTSRRPAHRVRGRAARDRARRPLRRPPGIDGA